MSAQGASLAVGSEPSAKANEASTASVAAEAPKTASVPAVDGEASKTAPLPAADAKTGAEAGLAQTPPGKPADQVCCLFQACTNQAEWQVCRPSKSQLHTVATCAVQQRRQHGNPTLHFLYKQGLH